MHEIIIIIIFLFYIYIYSADSNCILEGLIPTRYFEKTSERLSTANGSKLQIKYKLSSAIIEITYASISVKDMEAFLNKGLIKKNK